MPRDLILDFRQGGGSVPEIVHGIVRIWGTEVRPNATSLVLTTETTLKLSEGKATLLNAQTGGTGPLYDWAYIIQVEPFQGRNFRFYVAITDGTGPVNLKDLPKLNPITGEGFYLDIEEWEALYGQLPSRVDTLETSQATQDGKITNLEARPIGNTTMRIDSTVGERIFISDGITEKLVSADTGRRAVPASNGWVGNMYLRRIGSRVSLEGYMQRGTDPLIYTLITGFRPQTNNVPIVAYGVGTPSNVQAVEVLTSGTVKILGTHPGTHYMAIGWDTKDAWPTTLPGTAA